MRLALRDAGILLRLDLAEEAIVADPLHRSKRFELPDGTVVDLNEPVIIVMFEVRGGRIVLLDFRAL
jgi:hypothetical protein